MIWLSKGVGLDDLCTGNTFTSHLGVINKIMPPNSSWWPMNYFRYTDKRTHRKEEIIFNWLKTCSYFYSYNLKAFYGSFFYLAWLCLLNCVSLNFLIMILSTFKTMNIFWLEWPLLCVYMPTLTFMYLLAFFSSVHRISIKSLESTNPEYSCWISNINCYFIVRSSKLPAPAGIRNTIQNRVKRNNKRFSNGLSNANHISNFKQHFWRDSGVKCIKSIFLTNVTLPDCFVDRKRCWQLFDLKCFSHDFFLKVHLQQLLLCG